MPPSIVQSAATSDVSLTPGPEDEDAEGEEDVDLNGDYYKGGRVS